MTRPSPEIVVVDFGMGNLRSVGRSLDRAGARVRVSTDPDELRRADRVVLPGVGACGDAMRVLRETGLAEAIREHIRAGRPFLGICLGLQVLLDVGEEGPTECLGVIPGLVGRFPASLPLAVPHMGWNLVEMVRPHPVIRGGYYYFVHVYRGDRVSQEHTLATTDYGASFPSAVGFDACIAVQFHPEKSQGLGLALLERYCRWDP